MPDYLIGDQRDAVSDIYRAILRRDPDPEGMSHFAAMLGKQGLREVIDRTIPWFSRIPRFVGSRVQRKAELGTENAGRT